MQHIQHLPPDFLSQSTSSSGTSVGSHFVNFLGHKAANLKVKWKHTVALSCQQPSTQSYSEKWKNAPVHLQ